MTNKELAELYVAGHSTTTISKISGVNRTTLVSRFRKQGIIRSQSDAKKNRDKAQRLLRDETGAKNCYRCKSTKPLTDFYPRRDRTDAYTSMCKSCIAESDTRTWNMRRNNWLQRNYGLSESDYQRMFDAQHGQCFICKKVPKSGQLLCVDHNHDTGKIRHLLCRRCNLILGLVYEDPILLDAMADYLRVHTASSSDFEAEKYVKDLIS